MLLLRMRRLGRQGGSTLELDNMDTDMNKEEGRDRVWGVWTPGR